MSTPCSFRCSLQQKKNWDSHRQGHHISRKTQRPEQSSSINRPCRRKTPSSDGRCPRPFQGDLPIQTQFPIQDNISSYSGTSTNTGISQLSSIYIANQKKKTLTDEIISCLNNSIENLLPSLAQQSAEMIYKAILPYIEKQDKEIKELQSQIELLENVFKSMKFLTKNQNSFKNLSQLSTQLTGINSNVENCNFMLENQMSIEKGNYEYRRSQNEKISQLKEKMNYLKKLLEGEKDKLSQVNSNINGVFSDFIGLKKGINTQVGNLNKNLKFGKNIYETEEKSSLYISQLENLLEGFYKEVNSTNGIKVNSQQMSDSNVEMSSEKKKNIFKEEKFSF